MRSLSTTTTLTSTSSTLATSSTYIIIIKEQIHRWVDVPPGGVEDVRRPRLVGTATATANARTVTARTGTGRTATTTAAASAVGTAGRHLRWYCSGGTAVVMGSNVGPNALKSSDCY
jgi:hypothetical protein